ncbi:MAG: cation:proton antiporter family protein [Thalassolituus sp.]|jgi:glutathione-regulated potassium-efflux system ancillary protein KefC|uniref:Putative Glutathione-regulated potassium-efflux system protein KefB n=1 Tax=hydrothermal vent metagenome TaxID=652676 RepID=A0A170PMJ3_9ZZZZ|nr:cation:proton antiporter family protein [Thalassolituus oleivorans]AHK15242.1 potassium transporter Kef [Thalassolituus oleivorans R6-15]APR66386.1 potassium transporter Kef [Thalassolituus oleivorans]MBQ0781005.1 cation:proton antiporter [Thalassolituus oleivorans]MCA6129120.1 potassium transporter Kef [Thalassolituus oleivorans 4BN06-13]MDF1640044.1 cation:proton antiporter [Thalassolituus oleivorans]
MEYIWILVAFLCGFIARQLTMPPLVGFLLAGFGMNAAGIEPLTNLQTLADLGITLMLFTIGLKLDVRALLRTEVWATSIAHSGIWFVLVAALVPVPAWLGIAQVYDVSWQTAGLVAFALSFSSTVCVIKMLEDASELKVRHGKLAVGILIIQDIIAVLFLVASTGKIPSPWAFALLGLWLIRPVIYQLMSRAGHGELLPLMGFFLALGGAELFQLVHIKGDLGALMFGILLAPHAKSAELYKSLMGFKDLFLIGFFLSIGFTALPTLDMVPVTLGLLLLLLVKFALFFFLFVALGLPGRTAYLTSLGLANYSEFGLIVAHLGVEEGWLSNDWLVIIALAMSLSFIISSFLYRKAHHIYAVQKDLINRFERKGAHNGVKLPQKIDILILGMGRVGKGAYQTLSQDFGGAVCGVESDSDRVTYLQAKGLNVIAGDSDDMEFWQQAAKRNIRLVMLALPSQTEMRSTLEMMQLSGYQGRVAAVARYEDEREELLALGVDVAFNYYSEVGSGFAAESRHLLEPQT